MPLYTFVDTETGDQWDDFMSYDNYKKFLVDNPTINPVFGINVIGGKGDRVKTDSGMNDLLGRIARSNPTSPLADRYGDKGTVASKTRDAVRKNQTKHGISTKTN
jgi:hypothetical protein